MDRTEFSKFRDQHYGAIADINDKKGKDYAGDEDALANFKAAAKDLGLTPFQVWAVYHHKHQSAIDSFIKHGRVESEPIEGRIHDAILYLFLLLGLIEDATTEPAPGEEPSTVSRCPAFHEGWKTQCVLKIGHSGCHQALNGGTWTT